MAPALNVSLLTPPTTTTAFSMTTPCKQERKVLNPVSCLGGLEPSRHTETTTAPQSYATPVISPFAAARIASAKRLHARDDDVAEAEPRWDPPPKRVRYTEADVALPGVSKSPVSNSQILPTPPPGVEWTPLDGSMRDRQDTEMESGGQDPTGRLTAEREMASAGPTGRVSIKREPLPDDVPMSPPRYFYDSAPQPSRSPATHGVNIFDLCISQNLPHPIIDDEVLVLNGIQDKVDHILSGIAGKIDIMGQMPTLLRDALSRRERERVFDAHMRIQVAIQNIKDQTKQRGKGKGKGPAAPTPAPVQHGLNRPQLPLSPWRSHSETWV
jgi:hypothetical protein